MKLVDAICDLFRDDEPPRIAEKPLGDYAVESVDGDSVYFSVGKT